jgi:hypothetical protein
MENRGESGELVAMITFYMRIFLFLKKIFQFNLFQHKMIQKYF